MASTRKRLGDLLIESGLLTDEQLMSTLKDKPRDQRLGDALLQRGYITEQQLIEVLEFQLGIPHVNLFRYPFDPKLFNIVPKGLAKQKMIVPLKRDGDKLFVAMADPMDYNTIEDLRLSTGFHIETAIASKDDINRTITRYYDDELFDDIVFDEPEPQAEQQQEELVDNDSPIVRLVNQIISSAVSMKASDIHIDPQEHQVVIRFRVDGKLHTERVLPKHMQSMLIARIKIMGNLNITESRIPQDGRIKITIDFRPIDLRLSTLPTVFGEKVVMRILDLSSSLNDLAKLGFGPTNLKRFLEEIEKPNGIILISGPTGSGKSSTLYAALNRLNDEDVNIITIEDPVEYQLEGINQIQVNNNVGLSFATGLRSILRQDPDIVMVGEIRDKETVEIAIRASLTGHLVLSTIHTNDSVASISRLLDMGVEPFLLTASLNAIVAQRLIRRVCRDCGTRQPATQREQEIFAKRGMSIEEVNRGAGCPACNMTGYRGRIAIHEVLIINAEMREAINNNMSPSVMREIAERSATIFLIDDGLEKVKQGITTTEEVLRVALIE
ncbi:MULTISPECIES: GspE/PulE family protein [unclassified Sporosarcina]|uniref:GspE/PulE family protein n=1 Tax=unclassified Sporosarcina TaxID=2647733 RepID=UPI00203D76D5|nr:MULTISPECIES: GspE/PulE family protein [unclassified Sporosarcina]GKV66537.1 type II secretion system protein E [Sporosarcina sp. NCCP-2331]GLB56814.1 type II secretion system protein E [Sporosarcina sp. NCCP-2378]